MYMLAHKWTNIMTLCVCIISLEIEEIISYDVQNLPIIVNVLPEPVWPLEREREREEGGREW